MHLKRWLTSIVVLPILLGLLFFGGPVALLCIVLAANLVALWEYGRIVYHPQSDAAYVALSWITGTGLLLAVHQGVFYAVAAVLLVNLIIAAVVLLARFGSDRGAVNRFIRQAAGMTYIPLCLACLVELRKSPDGAAWVFLVICLAFAGDTAAYYAGTYRGKRKLCPLISPKKTVEGAFGGLAGSLVVAATVKALLLPAVPWGAGLVFFVVAGAVGQIGDLFESALKRESGIKDSGGLLPGHGGILDRIDGLLFVAPVTYFFTLFLAL